MWRIFENAYRRRAGREEVQAPHSIATTALRALTGGYVWLDAKRAVLASQEPIDDDTIRDVFTLLHGLAMGDDIDDIDLTQPVGIADKFASTPQEQRALADYLLRSPSGQPDAPIGSTRPSPGTSPAGSPSSPGPSTACPSGSARTPQAASSPGTIPGPTRTGPASPCRESGCR
jgi:hypothetical protein